MTTRFIIDPAQTDEQIVEFVMSMLEEDDAIEEPDVDLGETQTMEQLGYSSRSAPYPTRPASRTPSRTRR